MFMVVAKMLSEEERIAILLRAFKVAKFDVEGAMNFLSEETIRRCEEKTIRIIDELAITDSKGFSKALINVNHLKQKLEQQ